MRRKVVAVESQKSDESNLVAALAQHSNKHSADLAAVLLEQKISMPKLKPMQLHNINWRITEYEFFKLILFNFIIKSIG